MKKILTTITACMVLSGPVLAQDTTSADDLRAVLEDIRDWPPDQYDIAPRLAKLITKHKSKTLRHFKKSGEIESIAFLETWRNADVYYVRFKYNLWIVRFARDDDDKVVTLRYRIAN